MQRERNGFQHIVTLLTFWNLGQVQVRWASESSTQPSRQCFLKWFMIIRNRLCVWHVFMFSASRFHTSHRNRLCAKGPTALVCVPLGLRTCPVSCKVSAPSRHDHGLVKCSSRGPGSQWDVPAGDRAWARTNSWPRGLQGPPLHSQAVRSLALPPASRSTVPSSCRSTHPSSLLSENGRVESEKECVCETASNCVIDCAVKLTVWTLWRRLSWCHWARWILLIKQFNSSLLAASKS